MSAVHVHTIYMIIIIMKTYTLQIMMKNKQQSTNLRMSVKSFKKNYLADN